MGGLAVYLLVDLATEPRQSASDSASLLSRAAAVVTGAGVAGDIEGAEPGFSSLLAAHRAAADEMDAAALQVQLERAARGPRSAATDLRIGAWLARLSEIDPAHAALLAMRLGVARPLIVDAFQSWAHSDPGGALAELEHIDDLLLRRVVALELLDVIGDLVPGITRVAQALPEVERAMFQMEAVARLASYDLPAALGVTQLMLEGNVQRRAIQRVAAAAARVDPRTAIGHAVLLPEDLASGYRNTLALEWARVDAEGYLSYLAAQSAPGQELMGGLVLLATTLPERVLALSASLPASLRANVVNQVNLVLAERDPLAMIARLEEFGSGIEREMLLQAASAGYARLDPDAALAWVEQLDPPSQSARRQVLMEMAQRHPDRALDIVLGQPGQFVGDQQQIDQLMIMSLLGSRLVANPDRAVEFADRLLAEGGTQALAALQSMVSAWAQQAAEPALDWVMANSGNLNATTINSVAASIARGDVMAAAGYMDRLPPDMRPGWMVQVAQVYAGFDTDGALSWLAGYQGQEGYDPAYRQIVTRIARDDPPAAAALVSRSGPQLQLGMSQQIAANWSRQDPVAAANWASGLGDAGARTAAVGAAAAGWAAADFNAARRWTLGLPNGEVRDQALTSVLTASGVAGQPDVSLLDSFSSGRSAQQAVSQLAVQIARRDQDEARTLISTHIADPEIRRSAEQRIAAAGMQPVPVVVPSQGVLITR